MGNSLITLGVIFLALVLIAHAGHMLFPDLPYLDIICQLQNTQWLLIGAGASFASAFLLKVLAPMKQLAPKNRCKTCHSPIPKGDVYCVKCLREMKYRTINRT